MNASNIAPADLVFNEEIESRTAPLYDLVKKVIPEIEWAVHAPKIDAINRLKAERNAVILGHNYMTPEIYHCVADIVGDSLALARHAANTDAEVIVMAGVHFMAETAKLINPNKIVLIPDLHAGCSLAASITAADVRLMKEKYPGVPVVTYVNTSAEVKAESDICCTSGNAKQIIESLGVDRVIMLPDEYLALNVSKSSPGRDVAKFMRSLLRKIFVTSVKIIPALSSLLIRNAHLVLSMKLIIRAQQRV